MSTTVKVIKVIIIHHGYHGYCGVDRVVHRRWTEERDLVVMTGRARRMVIAPATGHESAPCHQQGGTTCKRRCPPPRNTNHLVRVGGMH